MKFDQARQMARAGYRIRLVSWVDRWLAFDGALWWIIPVDPLTRASTPSRIVQMTDCAPEWWSGEWTTGEIPRSSLEEILKYPQPSPAVVEFRALIDGSDFLHIGGDRLKLVHRNWDPATNVEVRVNAGEWIEWSPLSIDFDLGISTADYDTMAISILQARDRVVVTQPWRDDHGVILLDDDELAAAGFYWLQITLSSSLWIG